MKKKFLAILCIAALALVGLAGCGGDSTTTQGDAGNQDGSTNSGTLIIYSPLTQSMIDSMCTKFEDDTGIKVECLAMGTGDALKRIETEADNPQADILWSGTIGTVKNRS